MGVRQEPVKIIRCGPIIRMSRFSLSFVAFSFRCCPAPCVESLCCSCCTVFSLGSTVLAMVVMRPHAASRCAPCLLSSPRSDNSSEAKASDCNSQTGDKPRHHTKEHRASAKRSIDHGQHTRTCSLKIASTFTSAFSRRHSEVSFRHSENGFASL